MRKVRLSLPRCMLYGLQVALLLFCVVGAPVRAAQPPARNAVLVVYDSSDEYGVRCYQQTQIALRYARIPYHSHNLAESLRLPTLEPFTSVLITTERIWRLDAATCAELERYARSGGSVAVLIRGWNPHLGNLLGIANEQAPRVDKAKGRGLIFTKEFLPGIKDVEINDRLLEDISRYDVKLDSAVNVFATTWVGGFPVAWVRDFGKGKVIYWNTSLLAEKVYRGFIVASLGCVQPWTASMILNFETVCLDDFPLPSPNEKREPIKSEFDQTPSEFYSLRWYPDMMKLSQEFQIKYTAELIFNYAEMTKPPYGFLEWSRSKITIAGEPLNASVWMARQVSRENEMAFHGHNHQPLTISRWGTEENMIMALQAAKRRWEMDNLGREPSSYVPPMNIIDSVGLRAVVTVFPRMNVFASQFMGKFDLGQRREFGPEPWNNAMMSIPRGTSGYVMDDFNRMMTISVIHGFGVWNHFVHPDDVIPVAGRYQESVRDDQNLDLVGWYDEPKKDGLYYRFRAWLQFVKEHYPWLRSRTLGEAREIVAQYAASGSTATAEGARVRLIPTATPAFYLFYCPPGTEIVSIEGGEIMHKQPLAFSSCYVLAANSTEMNITLNHPLEPANLVGPPQGDLYAIERSGRPDSSSLVFSAAPPELKTPPQQAEELIGADKLVDAMRVLEDYLRENPNDAESWKRLGQLYEWRNLSSKTLKVFENLARLAPNDRTALKNLAQRYEWANRQKDAIPVYERILRMSPRDTSIMKTLAQNYIWANRQKEAIPLYEQLVKRDPRNVPLHRELADLYFGNSMSDAGIRQFEEIIRMVPSDTALMRALGEKYLEANRQTDAIRVFEQCLLHQPRNSSLRRRVAQLYLWNNAPAKAIEQFVAIVADDRNDREASRSLAQLYLETSNLDKAIPLYERLSRDEPENVPVLKRIGELYLWKERQQDAVPIYRRIVQAEPDSIPSRLMLGRLCLWTKDPVAAKTEFLEVARRDPRNTVALLLLGDLERSGGEWYRARSTYERVLSIDPANPDARSAMEQIRRDHGSLLRSSYERTEDSNDLVREQVPLGAGVVQGSDWELGVQALRQSVFDRRLSVTETGYGLGMRGQYGVLPGLSLTGAVLATSYTSKWVPVSLSMQADVTVSSRVTSALKLQRFETTEGVQAIRSQITVNRAAVELYSQTTDRLSMAGTAESDWYSDNNSKMTLASFFTYKVILESPSITLLANYAYQDSRIVYANSIPYWTPHQLSTTSLGISATQDLFEWFTIDAAYLRTLQAGVFSDNMRGRLTLKPSPVSQFFVEYEKLGSTVYSQNTFRAVLQYRY